MEAKASGVVRSVNMNPGGVMTISEKRALRQLSMEVLFRLFAGTDLADPKFAGRLVRNPRIRKIVQVCLAKRLAEQRREYFESSDSRVILRVDFGKTLKSIFERAGIPFCLKWDMHQFKGVVHKRSSACYFSARLFLVRRQKGVRHLHDCAARVMRCAGYRPAGLYELFSYVAQYPERAETLVIACAPGEETDYKLGAKINRVGTYTGRSIVVLSEFASPKGIYFLGVKNLPQNKIPKKHREPTLFDRQEQPMIRLQERREKTVAS